MSVSAAAVTVTEQSAEQSSASSNGATPAAAKSTKAKAGAIKKVCMLSLCECAAVSPIRTLGGVQNIHSYLGVAHQTGSKQFSAAEWVPESNVYRHLPVVPVHINHRCSFGGRMVHFKGECDAAAEDNEDGGAGKGNTCKLWRQSGSLC